MIFDQFRKKYIVITPEEWVRQHFSRYLVESLGYPPGLIGIEVMFRMNELSRRVDIMVYGKMGNPLMMIECKSPDVKLDRKVFDQIVEYNMKFRLSCLVVTNGIDHYACSIEWDRKSYSFLSEIPDYVSLLKMAGE